jgi:hypothetical protein
MLAAPLNPLTPLKRCIRRARPLRRPRKSRYGKIRGPAHWTVPVCATSDTLPTPDDSGCGPPARGPLRRAHEARPGHRSGAFLPVGFVGPPHPLSSALGAGRVTVGVRVDDNRLTDVAPGGRTSVGCVTGWSAALVRTDSTTAPSRLGFSTGVAFRAASKTTRSRNMKPSPTASRFPHRLLALIPWLSCRCRGPRLENNGLPMLRDPVHESECHERRALQPLRALRLNLCLETPPAYSAARLQQLTVALRSATVNPTPLALFSSKDSCQTDAMTTSAHRSPKRIKIHSSTLNALIGAAGVVIGAVIPTVALFANQEAPISTSSSTETTPKARIDKLVWLGNTPEVRVSGQVI